MGCDMTHSVQSENDEHKLGDEKGDERHQKNCLLVQISICS